MRCLSVSLHRLRYSSILPGDTGVGKTSVALRFVQDVFTTRTAPTVGASFLTKVMYVQLGFFVVFAHLLLGWLKIARLNYGKYRKQLFEFISNIVLNFD